MKVEDGVLENVHSICGPGVDKRYVSRYTCEVYPSYLLSSDRRPNLWARMWMFLLFGITVKKNANPTIDRENEDLS
jgi:hypothetical protein